MAPHSVDGVTEKYIRILEEELCPAMGCTEPIAVAYAGAIARKTLGCLPRRVTVKASGSIIKNVKSVIVPNTGGMRGIPAAVAAGIVAGDAAAELQVLAQVTPEQIDATQRFMEDTEICVEHVDNGFVFDLTVVLEAEASSVTVRIVNFHTNVVLVEKDGNILWQREFEAAETAASDHSVLNLPAIWEFANTVELERIKPVLSRQIQMNMAIAEEGLRGNYGANIGKILLMSGDDVRTRARAMAAAGSDARMNGCELPVVINSGSGNQGLTASVPLVVYAQTLHSSEETLYRALALSNLTAIYQKAGIGRLSAYCGAVSAGVGVGAGIAYLHGADYPVVEQTVINAVAILSGMICDGAKSSCAAKISEAVDAGVLGYQMARQGQRFEGGDGIVKDTVDETIQSVGRLAKDGMRQTNEEIIQIMIGE